MAYVNIKQKYPTTAPTDWHIRFALRSPSDKLAEDPIVPYISLENFKVGGYRAFGISPPEKGWFDQKKGMKMLHDNSITTGHSAVASVGASGKAEQNASKSINPSPSMDSDFDMLEKLDKDDEWNTVDDDDDYDWAKAEDSTEKQQQMEEWWKEKEEKEKSKKWFW